MHGEDNALDRRQFLGSLKRLGVAGLAGALGATALIAPSTTHPSTAKSDHRHKFGNKATNVSPAPIPGGVESGLPADHPLSFIHWFLPGPETAQTPVLALPGMGVEVEPSLITDFKGITAFSVLTGSATGSDGKNYHVEFDVRVMSGRYRGTDGKVHHGTFGFF